MVRAEKYIRFSQGTEGFLGASLQFEEGIEKIVMWYLFSKTYPSFLTVKEGSTSHLGLLQWSLHPLRFPRFRGTETSGKKRETALRSAVFAPPVFNSLYDPFGSPCRGQKPLGEGPYPIPKP